MSARYAFAAALSLAITCASSAFAQGTTETGTGTGPSSTVTAPNTSPVGRAKPPGAAAAPDKSDTREARTDRMKQDDQIMKGICIGCGTK